MTIFKGKKVLITGAGSGLGRLLAKEAAQKGASLILVDINGLALKETSIEFEQTSATSLYPCDLSQKENIYDMAKQILDDHGFIDILIQNAGIVQGKYLLESNDDLIEKTFAVNTLSLFWMTKAFLPSMMERNEGHIVTISSAGGLTGVCKLTDYCSSKFASFGFNESLRLELKELGKNIQTTVVCPYYMKTGMFEGAQTRFSFLLPILDPKVVCKKVIHAIEKNREILITPLACYSTFLTRILPVWLGDWISNFFGITKGMDHFTGRKKIKK
jgi:all-trans-retinol dehydrogenase (NAD+)